MIRLMPMLISIAFIIIWKGTLLVDQQDAPGLGLGFLLWYGSGVCICLASGATGWWEKCATKVRRQAIGRMGGPGFSRQSGSQNARPHPLIRSREAKWQWRRRPVFRLEEADPGAFRQRADARPCLGARRRNQMSLLPSRTSLFDDLFHDMASGFYIRPARGPLPSQIKLDVRERG